MFDFGLLPRRGKNSGDQEKDSLSSDSQIETEVTSTDYHLLSVDRLVRSTLSKGYHLSDGIFSEPRLDFSDPDSEIFKKLSKGGGFKVKIKKTVKKKNLFRFLLAKGFYEEEGLHLDEYLILWELYYQILGLLENDNHFREKYFDSLENLNIYFKEIGNHQEFPMRFDVKNPKMKELCSRFFPLLPSKNSYFGLRKQRNLRLGWSIIFNFETPTRKVRESRRIGVGYRDKGTKKPDDDGSPRWSEIQAHLQELEIRSEEEYQGINRDDSEFDWNRLWNSEKLSPIEKEKSKINI